MTGKGWGRSCNTKGDATLKFACWGKAEAMETSVCDARRCARQTEQKIIVSILRKDHELQWFPKAQAEDLPRLRLYPAIYVCQCRALSAQMMLCGRELMVPPCVLIQHLIMRKKCFFQSKPQITFEDKKQTAKSGAPCDEGERDGMKNRWRWGGKKKSWGLFNMC